MMKRDELPEMRTVEQGSAEWDEIWRALLIATGDPDTSMVDPCTGECWQYMGTYRGPDGWCHEFRHRWHPTQERRVYITVPGARRED
jgi:hypothetical protein